MHSREMILATLLAVAFISHARADVFSDHLGPRELAMGDSLRADARGSLAVSLNPAGLALARELVFEGSYGHRFTDSGHMLTLSGCDSTVALPGCFYYRYFSASPDVAGAQANERAHEGGAALARAISDKIMAGVNVTYFDYRSEATGEDTSGFTFDVGVIVQPMPMVSIAVAGYHLYGEESPRYPRALAAGLVAKPLPRLSLSFDSLWNIEAPEGQSTGRYGGGIEFFLLSADMQSGYPLRAGAVYDASNDGVYLAAGVGLISAKVGLDVGARRQIQGGDELVLQAGLRIFGPRQVSGTNEYR